MNITDEDELSADQLDKLRSKIRVEHQRFRDSQPKYSRKDMISLANYCLGEGASQHSSGKKWLKDWEKQISSL